MEDSFYISSVCRIKNNVVTLNGQTLFADSQTNLLEFIKSAAQSLDLNYPKFYKMDNLSKLAYLAADILLKDQKLETDSDHDIAIILSNKASSLDTDRKHQASIADASNFYPSPSVFVYTLPNICIGEISIKHQLHSENCFFISETFNAEMLHFNAQYLLKHHKAEKVLCGWVDLDSQNYDAFLYLVEENGTFAHRPTELLRLFMR